LSYYYYSASGSDFVNELNDSDTNTAKLLTFLVRYITSVTTNAKTFYVYFIHGTFYVFNVFFIFQRSLFLKTLENGTFVVLWTMHSLQA